MTSKAPISPCPFCGGRPYIDNERGIWRIFCTSSKHEASTGFYQTEQEARTAWNTRTTSEQTNERLAAEYVLASGQSVHASDCATSRAPAYEPGPCDCMIRDIVEGVGK